MSKEVTAEAHAAFLATYQARKALTQGQNAQHDPPMTYYQDERLNILALVLHYPKTGDRFFICQQYDNKTAAATADTVNDKAMAAACTAAGLEVKKPPVSVPVKGASVKDKGT